MPESLLQTKLYIPPLRLNLVPRPHLIERLNQGLQPGHKLTLVSVPAGFGKTTLVGEWAGGLRLDADINSHFANKVAWLSLDNGDNDPTRFLTYLVATLQTLALGEVGKGAPIIGEGAVSMLQSPQSPPTEAILISLLNDVNAVPDRIFLVLDDYHIIDSSPVDNALSFILDHLPPQMHLVIVTRADPDLPLARLRARGQLAELRAKDLRFSSSEAADFLNQVMGLALSAEEISALEDRTEGWIVGMQLAALSMQGKKDTAVLVKSFTGSHRFILDYLLEEVLRQQSKEVQVFLLESSILKQLNSTLCDALTGRDNSQEILETLESANLFIISLDEERRWYRYHHLFSDLLYKRLRQKEPDWVPMLHIKASEWYEQNGFVDEAIGHLLRAEVFERAAELIDQNLDAIWTRGEHGKLRQRLGALPDEVLSSRPQLCIFNALYLFTSGQQDAANHYLQAAEQALEPGKDSVYGTAPRDQADQQSDIERMWLRGRLAAIRAFIGIYYRADGQEIIEQSRLALEYLPQQDLIMRSLAAVALGDAYAFQGDMKASYQARSEALAASKTAGNVYLLIVANLKMAITVREQGFLRRVLELCRPQMELANRSGMSQGGVVGWLLAIWGKVLAELNDLDGAIELARRGVELVEQSGDVAMLSWSYLCLMRVLFSRGDITGAEEIFQKLDNNGRGSHMPPWFRSQMEAWQLRFWLAQDRMQAVSQWTADRGLIEGGEIKLLPKLDFFGLIEAAVLARVLIAQGGMEEAAELLQRLLEIAEKGDRVCRPRS